jgi:poly(3-hydroxybutyrate) depolymerase
MVPGAANCRTITAGGLSRRYVAYVPSAAATGPVPVVFMFHGSGGSGEQFYNTSGWRPLAESQGFIAVFPTGKTYPMLEGGKSTKWHDFKLTCDVKARPASWPAGAAYPANDESFVDAILADLAVTSDVDSDRFYASGFSNGSAFAQRLAVTRADTFAAIGSWAGSIHECIGADGQPVEPVIAPHLQQPARSAIPSALGLGSLDAKFLDGINANLIANGQAPLAELPLDQAGIERYLGSMLRNEGNALGLAPVSGTPIAVTDWAGVAWLPGWTPPVYTTLQWDDPVVGNASGNTFTFMMLKGVTHRYPNATIGKPTLIKSSSSVNAAAMFWQFFERHVGT